jgi:hypothetical protein
MDRIDPGVLVERRFFTIVRWFGLIITSIALGIAVITAIDGLLKLFRHPNTTVHAPTVTYGDFRPAIGPEQSSASRNPDTTLQQKQAEAAKAAAEAEFEKQLKPHLDAIVGNITTYADNLGQAKPDAKALGDYVRTNMQQVLRLTGDQSLQWSYVSGLEKATHDLAADASRLSKLDPSDPNRVRWNIFIDWFTDQYKQRLSAELQRINVEKMETIAGEEAAPALFYGAASAFGIFVVFTLLLLLLRIELNTRPS